jgi:hypothetical protein
MGAKEVLSTQHQNHYHFFLGSDKKLNYKKIEAKLRQYEEEEMEQNEVLKYNSICEMHATKNYDENDLKEFREAERKKELLYIKGDGEIVNPFRTVLKGGYSLKTDLPTKLNTDSKFKSVYSYIIFNDLNEEAKAEIVKKLKLELEEEQRNFFGRIQDNYSVKINEAGNIEIDIKNKFYTKEGRLCYSQKAFIDRLVTAVFDKTNDLRLNKDNNFTRNNKNLNSFKEILADLLERQENYKKEKEAEKLKEIEEAQRQNEIIENKEAEIKKLQSLAETSLEKEIIENILKREQLKSSYEAKIEEMRKNYEENLATKDKEKDDALTNLRNSKNKEIEIHKQDLKNKDIIIEAKENEINDLTNKIKNEMIDKTEHEKIINEIEKQKEEAIKQKEVEIETLKEEKEKALADFNILKSEIEKLKKQLEAKENEQKEETKTKQQSKFLKNLEEKAKEAEAEAEAEQLKEETNKKGKGHKR